MIGINDLGVDVATGNRGTTVAFPGFRVTGQALNPTLPVSARDVANATLTATRSR